MAEGRSRQLWGIAASQMALLANLQRDPNKSRKFSPRDFDPHTTAKETSLEQVDITVLKQVFCS